MSKYHATKFFIDENYQVNYHPTEIFDSIEQVFDCAQGFLITKNYIQQVKKGWNESYIKCVEDDTKLIHLSPKIE